MKRCQELVRAYAWPVVAGLVTMVGLPDVALADNCSSLGDCFGTAGAAALTAIGAAGAAMGACFSSPPNVDPDPPPPEGDSPINKPNKPCP